MKTTSTLLCLLLLLSAPAFSQQTGMRGARSGGGMNKEQQEERINQSVQKATERLKLSAEQSTKLHDILMQTRDEMRLKMKDIRSAPQDQRKAMRREIMEHADSKILAMLNPDQQKQYQSYKQEMREDMKKRASDRRQQRSELDDEVY